MSAGLAGGLPCRSQLTPVRTVDLDIYDNGELPWSRAEEALGHGALAAEGAMYLSTVTAPSTSTARRTPRASGALWHDGAVRAVSGPGTRKGRNLAARWACTVALRLDGLDLVVEGRARRTVRAAGTSDRRSQPSRRATRRSSSAASTAVSTSA